LLQTGKIKIEGVQTSQDVNKALKVLNEVWGIRDVTLSLTGEATIQYDEMAASFRDFEQAVIDSGFDISGK
jgi:copper chaperone CopZ